MSSFEPKDLVGLHSYRCIPFFVKDIEGPETVGSDWPVERTLSTWHGVFPTVVGVTEVTSPKS